MANPVFVICTDNTGFEASLEPRKLYELLPDIQAKKLGQLRVIDESGDDYLFPESMFVLANLPAEVASQLAQAA